MNAAGGITAINAPLAQLCGCQLSDVEGFRWIVHFGGRERIRVLNNWVDFAQGNIECFYEESTWRRPSDQSTMQIATRGLFLGSQLVCSIADITLILPSGGSP
jgi:PAS domain-containing protein